MAQATAAIVKIPTESPQPAPSAQLKRGTQAARARRITGGSERAATRGDGEVITLDCGITVYPARSAGGRWRAVWHEDGRREQCEAPSEEKLAAKLEKVKIRLEADAPKMRQPGAALIAHFLDPDRLPVGKRWSRKHTYTVHWQAGDRPLPEPEVSAAGESGQWVDPAEIPSSEDVAKLGRAMAARVHGDRHELMVNTAAYSGLRWGELVALTASQVDPDERVITVAKKAVKSMGRPAAGKPRPDQARKPRCPLTAAPDNGRWIEA
jgi:hypothetical protein